MFSLWLHNNLIHLWCHLQDSYPIGDFNQLISLKLCTCSSNWCRLILQHTPKLRVLRFEQLEKNLPTGSVTLADVYNRCYNRSVNVQTQWEQPSSVPLCLTSSLETVEWIGYKGTQVEKNVVMYLLENSGQLKTMAIRSLKSTQVIEKVKMLEELLCIQRRSRKCRLLLTWSSVGSQRYITSRFYFIFLLFLIWCLITCKLWTQKFIIFFFYWIIHNVLCYSWMFGFWS